MVAKLPHTDSEVNARELKVRFSAPVREALGTLESAAQQSSQIDSDVYAILKDWSSGKPSTVHDVMIAMPLIAEQVANHINATHDEKAKEAWLDVCIQLGESGFTVSQSLQRTR